MTWQRKALRTLIRTTCNADRRNTVWSTSVNARLNRVHDIAASYAAVHGARRLPRAHVWPGVGRDKGGAL